MICLTGICIGILSNLALTRVSVLNQTSLGFSACTPDLSVTLALPFWAGDIYFENCHCENQSKETQRFLFFSAFSNCTDLQADTQTSCDSGSPLVPSKWAKFGRKSMLLRFFFFTSFVLFYHIVFLSSNWKAAARGRGGARFIKTFNSNG